MRVNIIIILIIVASLKMLTAQYLPLVEESKYWVYNDFQGRPRPTTGFIITIKGDTILENKLYKKVFKYELIGEIKTLAINEPPQFVANFPYEIKDKELIALIREDIDKQIIYNLPLKQDSCTIPPGDVNPCNDIIFCDTIEHILFDFSLQTDDMLNYCSYAPLHYNWELRPEKVDSIKEEFHFGKLRKTFYTIGIPSYLPNLWNPGPSPISIVKIIEGVGFKNQGIYNYRFGQLIDYCEGDEHNCNIVSSTNETEIAESEVNLYPNPTSKYLYFGTKRSIIEMALINLNADVLIRVKNEMQMDLNNVPEGVYICRIKLDNGRIINKKVIKINQ